MTKRRGMGSFWGVATLWVLVATVPLTIAVLAEWAPPAQATKFVHQVSEGQFGGNGPRDVAVNRASVPDGSTDPLGDSVDGYVYVADNGSHRIQVFDSDGEFRFMFGGGVLNGFSSAQICTADDLPCSAGVPGASGGMFNEPQGLVVDQDTGHLFVRERASGNPRVQEFRPDGTFVRAWGWDVVQEGTSGDSATDQFETCFVATECQRGAFGAGLGQFGNNSARGGGIDRHTATGDLLVADPGNQRILRFDVPADATGAVVAVGTIGPISGFATNNVHVAVDGSGIVYAPNNAALLARYDLTTSAFIAPLGVAAVTGSDAAATTRGLEVDPLSGNLFVARDRSLGGERRFSPVFELGNPGASDPGDVVHLDTHVEGTDFTWNGVGLDSDSGDMYMAGTSPSGVPVVVRAGDGPLPPPVVTFEPYSDVDQRTATVNFSIDTTGLVPVDYELQLATSDSPGSFITVASGEIDGSEDPVAVSETVSGLRPGSVYAVRVLVSKAFNNPSATTDNLTLLETDPAAPDVVDVGADSVTEGSARLTGRIDPNGVPTSYRFEWGIGGFENSIPVAAAPVGDGFGFEFVAQQLSGLASGTTYRFRLVATSDEGATIAEATFTTLAAAQAGGRAFELVTPADKYGGQGVGFWPAGLGHLGSSGIAAHEGERFAAQGQFGSTLDGNGGFSHSNDWVFAERGDNRLGWLSRSPLTHPNYAPQTGQGTTIRSAADDLSAVHWKAANTLAFFPEMAAGGDAALDRPGWANLAVGLLSNWGSPLPGGPATRWELFGPARLDQVADASEIESTTAGVLEVALSGSGSTAVGQPGLAGNGRPEVHGLAGASDPTWPGFGDLVSGRSLWSANLSGGLADSFAGTGPRELLNVCSGTPGVDRTQIPAGGAGVQAGQECSAGIDGRPRLISDRGAAFSSTRYIRDGAVSDDGSRVFFLSPDPVDPDGPFGPLPAAPVAGCVGEGATSRCPSQLYVAQRNPDGGIVTRWVSRAEEGLFGAQAVSLTGAVRFEGASADGRRVFFRTNSPLTADDPNGLGAAPAGGVTAGAPHPDSSDLYMFELADGPDPTGPGSSLTRVSAGPGGDGDCNSPLRASGIDNDEVGALRFVSDDGSRAYFTCQAPLPAVDVPADAARITEPDGTPTTADQANVYLYDHNLPQPDRWRFVARLPRATGQSLATCATTGVERRSPFQGDTGERPVITRNESGSNCVSGTADGRFVTLFTEGRLTADDPGGTPVDDPVDNPVADIYGYDADADRLTRITAPQGGDGAGYPCLGDNPASTDVDESLLYTCRGDAGMDAQVGVSWQAPGPSNLGVASMPLVSGDRVAFFQSATRLTPDDRDGGYDVYEWRNGALSLVTSGDPGSEDALYKGNDRSGRNVYFVTREALTWQDRDVVADIYTARVGGGVDQPPEPPVCPVLAGGCHGGGAVLDGSGVSSLGPGSGNVKVVGKRGMLRIVRPSRKALRRAARSGVLRVRVRTPGAGIVRGVVRARLSRSGGMRRVAADRARARKAGSVVLRLRLSRPAVRRLRAGQQLRLGLRVAVPGARSRSLRLTLRRAGK